ncbi:MULTISPECIES: c-type cytochrome [unclassified Aeromicrobium]|uniref:cytochrome bc1 complex diheme cytochrome c subunit n=1 Tax=unclassified Aeromicrobium TaxID=2633570 RepID=UPI0006F88CBF|nr:MULTISPECIES: cytochrome c [unclassified Aeromicrobium]KQO37574.1 cytochrome C [Aeromicrobium sp. Leaf245]KQP26466.1 cytochrome C [Aeromicrobium sp. Leaf272]KQP76205.1 cytochrome C [Aeromicrobium sp. Leaf289]KQP85310.1 cytochrome C [Aeromicrobium sp. Leaf291]
MRTLSTRRRHPLAGLAVLLLGLVTVGALWAAAAPKAAQAEEYTARDVEVGRELFLIGCASCHGQNAEGITTKDGGNYGPSLIGVGAAAVDFQVGTGRMPMAQSGPQAPRKAPEYDAEETKQLAAYIASLAPGPAIPAEDVLDYENVDEEGLKEGGEFFRTNCTACHNSVGAGGALPNGRYAPTLKGVSAKHLYEAMQTGPQQMPVFNDDIVTPEDKRNIIAYIKNVQEQPNYGGVGGGGLGPVVDGVFVWVVGIGGLVGFAIWIGAHGARVKTKKKAA